MGRTTPLCIVCQASLPSSASPSASFQGVSMIKESLPGLLLYGGKGCQEGTYQSMRKRGGVSPRRYQTAMQRLRWMCMA